MEGSDGAGDIVHPEVRAHVNSLVSALGGLSTEDNGQYQLGDDALEVLRDLKRWIRFYDEKTNRMDVARCILDANLVEGDMLPILALWPQDAMDSKFKARIALACFEVMVPLTWPMERDKERMTVNHHRHMPVLELAQVAYKRAIINFDETRVLHAAVRAALPSVATPIGDRTPRDQGVIKLALFFLRNMAMIAPPPHVKYDGDETQISRSATIDAFSYQDVFVFLLTIASNMGEEFRTEDTTIMEIMYHLVKRVDIKELFMDEQQVNTAKATELSTMMSKESDMLKAYNRKGPTRHNRFGTMIWMKREDGKMSSLSGQDALADASLQNQKLDSSKTFRPARRARKHDKDERDLGQPVKLNARAKDQLRSFVESFLDSGFNPLFSHIRKTIDREAPHVLQFHKRQFFYLVAWFLEAERTRQSIKQGSKGKGGDVSSFNLVAGVLNQEMFITITKTLHDAYEYKDWHQLNAVMRCFTQILLTVQTMADSANEDDQEIAENVLSRLFYEGGTHDVIANIIRTYKDQGFDYLDAATDLVHHFLRILEAYAKQNVDMQVRSRKRTRRKKKASEAEGADPANDGSDDSADDKATAERTTKERKFDFHRFSSRFTPQGVVDAFVTFLKFYRDLDDTQLKRAHRYFYRVAFKQEMSVMLFRVDAIHLFYNMIKGPEPLPTSSISKEWEELVKQILRKLFKKIEERPELLVEMLFSKLPNTAFFLELGYEKQTLSSKAQARPGAELVFKQTEEKDQQIAIAVGALLDKNESDDLLWLKKALTAAETERRAFADAERARQVEKDAFDEEQAEQKETPCYAVRPDNDARRKAMFKNSHLRLLMKLCDVQPQDATEEETADSTWGIPGDVTPDQLRDTLHYITQAEFSPPTFEGDTSAEQQLKRKTVTRPKAHFDDDEDGEADDENLFPPNIGDSRAIDGPKKKKGTRRIRRKIDLDPDELSRRAKDRLERDKEKRDKIKSNLYIEDGEDDFDEAADEAFFARERAMAAKAEQVARSVGQAPPLAQPKRKSTAPDSDDDGVLLGVVSSPDASEEGESDDVSRKRRRLSPDASDEVMGESQGSEKESEPADGKRGAEEDEEDAPVLARRPRARGGFVIDSDDE